MGTHGAHGIRADHQAKGLQHFETVLDPNTGTATKYLRSPRRTVTLEALLRNEASILDELGGLVTPRSLYCGPRGDDYVLETNLLGERTLSDLIKDEPVSPEIILEVGEKTALALQIVHDRGFVHGDLKPEHILLGQQSLFLCDFGLACPLGAETGVGCTPLYAAPEQLGLVKGRLGAETDLYALGTILLELFLGENPWRYSELSDRVKVDWSYSQLPRDVEPILRRLLHPDPQRRYSSGLGLAADLGALSRGEALAAIGCHDLRSRPTLSAFVGRARELEELEDWVAREPLRPVAISALSGMGKSRLLEEFAGSCRRMGVTPLYVRGRLSAQAIGYPLCRELASLIKANFLSATRDLERLAAALGYWSQVLARAFEPLRELTDAEYDLTPHTSALVDAWCALMQVLATGRDFVILIDDLQWADPLTLDWLSRQASCGARVVVAYRPEEVDRLGEVARLFERVMTLQSLSDEESQDLVRSMAGDAPQEVLDALVERGAGDPFMLQSLVWGCYESNSSMTGGEVWNYSWRSIAPTMQAGMLLAQRLRSLSDGAQRLLRGAAALGKEFPRDQATFLASLTSVIAEEAWSQVTERHLVWLEGGRAGFTHDKIREALLAEPCEDEDVSLHHSAAEWLLVHEPLAHDRLALHLAAAKREREALEHARLGEAEALAGLDFATAESMQKLLHSLAGRVGGKDEHARCCLELGRTLARRSGYAEAVEVYREGLAFVRDQEDEFDLMVELAFSLVKDSRLEEAKPLAEACFERIGIDLPASSVGRYVQAGITWKKFLTRLEKNDGPVSSVSPRRAEAAGKLFRLTTEMGSILNDKSLLFGYTVYAAYYGLCHPSASSAICISLLGLFSVALGRVGTGERLFEKARELSQYRPEYLAEVLGQSSFVTIAKGELQQSSELHLRSIELSSLQGDAWNRITSLGFLAQINQLMGRFQQASVYATEVLDSSGADETCKLTATRVLCLTGESQNLILERPRYDNSHPNRLVCLAEQSIGLRELQFGRFDDGIRHLQKASETFEPGIFFFGAPSASWLASAYRVRGESRSAEDTAAAQSDFKKAQRAAHKALKDTKYWLVCRPHALREYALASAHAGRFHLARKALEESWTLSEQMGMQFESAWTLHERGRLAKVAGWRDWSDDQAEGLARVRRLGGWLPGVDLSAPATGRHLAQIDRFDRVLAAGRRLVAIERERLVLETLAEEAKSLLRCDRVRLVESEDQLEGLSRTLYRRCLVERRAVTEAHVGEPTQSLLLHEARSTLMAPVALGPETIGVLVTWQRSLGGFFGEEELRLADYLCSLAEAGLENAKMLRQREETYKSLKASEERFRDFFRYAGVGTALLSDDGTTVEENDYLQTLLSGSTLGKRPWEYCHSEDRESLKAGFRAMSQTRERCDLELRLHRSGGEVAWAQCCLVRLPVPLGDQRHYLFTVADTTHKRVAEMMNFLEGERRSLAAEVHDGLSQNMTALHFLLSGLGDEDPKVVRAKELSSRLVEDASALISSLRNPLTEGIDLLPALKDLVLQFSVEHSADFRVAWPDQLPVISDLSAMVLYRVVQEGLANIRKHARAGLVTLDFAENDAYLEITLTDDGVGFDAVDWLSRRGVKKHFGLLSMRDRVEMVGGQFSVSSEPGGGVVLVVGFKSSICSL